MTLAFLDRANETHDEYSGDLLLFSLLLLRLLLTLLPQHLNKVLQKDVSHRDCIAGCGECFLDKDTMLTARGQ